MKQVLDGTDISRAIRRIANEITERNRGAGDLLLVGIQTRGVPLAGRIRQELNAIEGTEVPVGTLDIGLYRDDLASRPAPVIGRTDIPDAVEGRTVVLVDDVSTRAARSGPPWMRWQIWAGRRVSSWPSW